MINQSERGIMAATKDGKAGSFNQNAAQLLVLL